MDKRREKRIKTRILVKIDGKSGILNDFSQQGLQISTNSPPSRRQVDIVFNLSGKDVSVKGLIQWIRKRYSVQNAFQVGCLVENPPVGYFHLLLNR